jgi:integral membrane protein
MIPFIVAFISSFFVLSIAYGSHIVRREGASKFIDVPPGYGIDSAEDNHRLFSTIIDSLGLRTQKTLRRAYGDKRLNALSKRIRRAGNPDNLTLDLYIQREAGFILLSVVILILFTAIGSSYLGVLFGLLFSTWMQVWLLYEMRRRRSKIDRDLPDFLDVLTVTIRSGMPFRNALERVCEHYDSPLSKEMMDTLREIRMGVPFRTAFLNVKERCDSENFDSFVVALLQSEELGTPIADALQSIVKEIRRERAEQVRQAAAKTAPKVAFIATVTMMPGTIILMMGGMFYAYGDVFSKIFKG